MPLRPLHDLDATPAAVFRAWPASEPLAACWSGGGPSAPDARWTLLARPGATVVRLRPEDPGPQARLVSPPPPAEPSDARAEASPFGPGWFGLISYEAGAILEPAARAAWPADRRTDWPLVAWQRCDDLLVHDATSGRWWAAGRPPVRNNADVRRAGAIGGTFRLDEPRSDTGEERYREMVSGALERIRAGEVYQVNLAHHLEGAFAGSGRDLFLRLSAAAGPWYGAYMELDAGDRRLVAASASPELFFRLTPGDRRVVTRPMKGTLPASGPPGALEASGKDRAELAMIVDLMRNDLGRVCDLGSVRVEHARTIERHGGPARAGAHPGLWQATAAVAGRLREGLGVGDVLAAAFPGGSVTGAPKISAMRLIERFEARPRGPYCGSFGHVADSGHSSFNIAIRTAVIEGVSGRERAGGADRPGVIADGVLRYAVGAGIVADSDPGAEWHETLAKAGVLRGILDRGS